MNVEEYERSALDLIKSSARSKPDGKLTAAQLGALLRRTHPGLTWRDLGFRSLGEFLKRLSMTGAIVIGETRYGALAVSTTSNEHTVDVPAVPTNRTPPTYNPLAKQFWQAFAVEVPPGRRYFHRLTHFVRLGATETPSPADEWVEITPISRETQKQWANSFLESSNCQSGGEVARALDAPDWYRRFHELLFSNDPELAKRWNQERSQRISNCVKSWCTKNAVDPSVAFQSYVRRDITRNVVAHLRAEIDAGAPADARKAILAALSKLPTEYLLEIPIPGKYFLDRGRE
jgi:hypothetical protein